MASAHLDHSLAARFELSHADDILESCYPIGKAGRYTWFVARTVNDHWIAGSVSGFAEESRSLTDALRVHLRALEVCGEANGQAVLDWNALFRLVANRWTEDPDDAYAAGDVLDRLWELDGTTRPLATR